MHNVMIIVFFTITVRPDICGILLTFRKDLHGRIISLRRKVWDHKTSLTPPLFIEVPVLSER